MNHLQNKIKEIDVLFYLLAWCYLNIGNLTELPNAQESLKECERNFEKNYGPNLERVKKLKGTASSEEALFMRLHLLQAIAAFISGQRPTAVLLFKLAKEELKKLMVPIGMTQFPNESRY